MAFGKLFAVRNRIAFYCAFFILYVFLGMALPYEGIAVALGVFHFIAFVVFIIFAVFRKGNSITASILFLACTLGIIVACFAKYVYYYPSQRFLLEHEGKECGIAVRVDKVDSFGEGYGNYNCSILFCDGREVDSVFGIYPSVRVSCFDGDIADKGDVIYLEGKITRPEKETSSGFREENYLKSRHIFMCCDYYGSLKLISAGEKSGLDMLRDKFSESIMRYVDDKSGDEALIAKCMLLGDKSGVTSVMKDIFMSAGVSHILNVSGLHLSILFMTASAFLRLRRRTSRRRFVYGEAISCVLVLVYMTVANFTPSIMRAGFMLIFMNIYSAVLFYRRRLGRCKEEEIEKISDDEDITSSERVKRKTAVVDSVSSLFCAGALILIISPYSLFDVGMQLSFMSTLGILTAVAVFDSSLRKIRNPVVRFCVFSFLITLSSAGFTLPVGIYNFGAISAVSVFTNLVAVPLMTPLLVILLLLVLIALLPSCAAVTAVCSALGWIASLLCNICIRVAEFFGSMRFSVIPIRENIVLAAVFAVLAVITVWSIFCGAERIRNVGFISLEVLYLVFALVCFTESVIMFSRPDISFCTVERRPYFCLSKGDNRIFFDNASGVASESVIEKSLGEQFYKTDNFYVVVPYSEADADALYFNITYFHDKKGIKSVLLPSAEACENAGIDIYEYDKLVGSLRDYGIDTRFYTSEFRIGKTEFRAHFSDGASNVDFCDIRVIFAEDFDEATAKTALESFGACVYFCDKAGEMSEYSFGEDSLLYVSSPHYKKIGGAKGIPVRKPESFGISDFLSSAG